jgi:hypothetical protein
MTARIPAHLRGPTLASLTDRADVVAALVAARLGGGE